MADIVSAALLAGCVFHSGLYWYAASYRPRLPEPENGMVISFNAKTHSVFVTSFESLVLNRYTLWFFVPCFLLALALRQREYQLKYDIRQERIVSAPKEQANNWRRVGTLFGGTLIALLALWRATL